MAGNVLHEDAFRTFDAVRLVPPDNWRIASLGPKAGIPERVVILGTDYEDPKEHQEFEERLGRIVVARCVDGGKWQVSMPRRTPIYARAHPDFPDCTQWLVALPHELPMDVYFGKVDANEVFGIPTALLETVPDHMLTKAYKRLQAIPGPAIPKD